VQRGPLALGILDRKVCNGLVRRCTGHLRVRDAGGVAVGGGEPDLVAGRGFERRQQRGQLDGLVSHLELRISLVVVDFYGFEIRSTYEFGPVKRDL